MQGAGELRSVLLDPGGTLLFWDDSQAGGAGPREGMRIETYACEETDCPWVHVQMTAEEPEADGATCRGRIHMETLEVLAGKADGRASRVARLLGHLEELIAAPDGALLEILRRRWRRIRGRREPTWQTQDWSDWSPGDLVSYMDVDRDAPGLMFRTSQGSAWADDLHCITAGCHCADVLVRFEAMQADHGGLLGAVRVDLARGKLRPVEDGAAHGDQTELWKALRVAHPDIEERLKRRRDHVRRVAPQIRQLAGFEELAPLPAARRVGRNDPCSCGSGRKYKRCCL